MENFQWTDHVDKNDIPREGKVLARISDNMLDDGDWGIVELTLAGGYVISVVSIFEGVYCDFYSVFYGMDRNVLALWSHHETKGHPLRFNELLIDSAHACRAYVEYALREGILHHKSK